MGDFKTKTIYKTRVHALRKLLIQILRSDTINALGNIAARYYRHLVKRHPESLAFLM